MVWYFIYGLLLQLIIIGISLAMQNRELIQNLSFAVFMLICIMGGSGRGWGFFGIGLKQDEAEGKDDYYVHRHRANLRVILFMLPSIITLAVYAWAYGLSIF